MADKVFTTLGARNYAKGDRERLDYYATNPIAVDKLLKVESFNKDIWEPSCGGGHISERLKMHGYDVYSTDLVDRGYKGMDAKRDFMCITNIEQWKGDIISNPPYAIANDYIRKAMGVLKKGSKLALFLKVLYMESKGRYYLFEEFPPSRVYVMSSRVQCAIGGNFEEAGSSAIAYAWWIWERGHEGETILRWVL